MSVGHSWNYHLVQSLGLDFLNTQSRELRELYIVQRVPLSSHRLNDVQVVEEYLLDSLVAALLLIQGLPQHLLDLLESLVVCFGGFGQLIQFIFEGCNLLVDAGLFGHQIRQPGLNALILIVEVDDLFDILVDRSIQEVNFGGALLKRVLQGTDAGTCVADSRIDALDLVVDGGNIVPHLLGGVSAAVRFILAVTSESRNEC